MLLMELFEVSDAKLQNCPHRLKSRNTRSEELVFFYPSVSKKSWIDANASPMRRLAPGQEFESVYLQEMKTVRKVVFGNFTVSDIHCRSFISFPCFLKLRHVDNHKL